MKLKVWSVVWFVFVMVGSMNLQSVPRALVNVGNTCYLNSLVQNLYNMPGLVDAFIGTNFRTIMEAREQTIAEGWKKDLPKQKQLAKAM